MIWVGKNLAEQGVISCIESMQTSADSFGIGNSI